MNELLAPFMHCGQLALALCSKNVHARLVLLGNGRVGGLNPSLLEKTKLCHNFQFSCE